MNDQSTEETAEPVPRRTQPPIALLLAATVCVDIVFVFWIDVEVNFYRVALFLALIFGQLSIACIWSTYRAQNIWAARLTPIVATIMAAAATSLQGNADFLAFVGFHGTQTVGLMLCLWQLKRTPLWRQAGGTSDDLKWQFNVAQLLLLMLLVALLITALRTAPLFYSQWSDLVVFSGGSILVALITTAAWNRKWNWFLRLALALGLVTVLGYPADLLINPTEEVLVAKVFLLQVVVIWIWLWLGQIMPRESEAASASIEPPAA